VHEGRNQVGRGKATRFAINAAFRLRIGAFEAKWAQKGLGYVKLCRLDEILLGNRTFWSIKEERSLPVVEKTCRPVCDNRVTNGDCIRTIVP